MEQTLLLNSSFEPIKVLDWQRAVTLWVQKKVEVIEVHDREIRSVRFTFKMPSVVRLLKYARIRRKEVVPFTRANIYARDRHECQYCGEHFRSEDLTFDHVIPQTKGGTKSWENIVAACVDCNRRKGGRTPAEAGMTLQRKPLRPTSIMSLQVTIGMRRAPQNWHSYLYWHVELDEK
jgi:5-methylcytosine-specific restriction endonuclease McrA